MCVSVLYFVSSTPLVTPLPAGSWKLIALLSFLNKMVMLTLQF